MKSIKKPVIENELENMEKTEKENLIESKKSKELLTAKETRSKIARIFLDKYNEIINKKIPEVKHDMNMTEEEKKIRIDELHKELYKFKNKMEVGYADLDFIQFNRLSKEESEMEQLAYIYTLSYVKHAQINNVKKQLKNENDPNKKQILEEKLKNLQEFYEHVKYLRQGYREYKNYEKYEDLFLKLKSKKSQEVSGISFGKFIVNLITKNGGLNEGDFINLYGTEYGYGKYKNRMSDSEKETFLETIRNTGGLKEGCEIRIGGGGRCAYLARALIDDAIKKGINSRIVIWKRNQHIEKNKKIFESGCGSDFEKQMRQIRNERSQMIKNQGL